MGDLGYRMLGRATWRTGRWYLRRRYGHGGGPSKAKIGAAAVGLAAAGVLVKVVLHRVGDAVGDDRP